MRPFFAAVDFREAVLTFFFDFAARLAFLAGLPSAKRALTGSAAGAVSAAGSTPAASTAGSSTAKGAAGIAGMGSGAFFTTDTFAEAEGWIGWSCATSSAGHMKATVPDLSLSVWLSQAANALPGKQNTANMIKPVRFTPMLLRLVQGDAATRKNARRPRLCTAELAPICGNLQIKANTDPRQPVLGRPGSASKHLAMRSNTRKPRRVFVGLSVNQHHVRFDMAITKTFVGSGKRMVAVFDG